MKKLLSIVLAILMIATTVPFALAAETAVPDTVYFDNTSSAWSKVNAYFFNDSYQSVSASWPGTQMTEAGDNIYSIEVPEGALYVIFNDGANQTANLTIPTDGANCYDYGSNGWTAFSSAADVVASGNCGETNAEDVSWSLDSEGTLTISGTGRFSFEWYEAPWLSYADSILNVVIEEGVTNIPATAFDEFENAVSLSIPATVTEIETYCNNLFSEFRLAEGNTAFVLVDGVLFNADKTTLLMYPAKNTNESYTVPDGVTALGEDAFEASKVKTVTLSDSVLSIGEGCFHNASLENISFGANVESIGFSAFGFTSLVSVALPENLTVINHSLFWACQNLKTLVIGSNITTINSYALGYCDALETVHFNGTEEQWAAITKPEDTEDKVNTVTVHYGPFGEKAAVDATCGVDGHTVGLYCDDCDVYLTGEVISATGEHENYTNSVCDVCGSACTHENVANSECSDCRLTGKFVIVTMNDSYGDGWTGNAVIIRQLLDGEYEDIETVTFDEGDSYTYTTVLFAEDVYALVWNSGIFADECSFTVDVDGETVYEATDGSLLTDGQVLYKLCGHPGQTGETCEICGTELHTCDFSGEWTYDSEKHWKKCECGLTGEEATHSYAEGECECGYVCPHSFTKYNQTKAPECGVAGKEVASCDHGCGVTDEKEISALEHKPLEAVKENEVAPQCEAEGSYDLVVYCDLCGDELDRDTVAVAALGHKWIKNILVRPDENIDGSWTDGYYYDKCKNDESHNVITGVAKRADYTAYENALAKIREYNTVELTAAAEAEIRKSLAGTTMVPNNLVEGEGSIVFMNNWVKSAEAIIAKIESGEYVKADYTVIDEVIADIDTALETATISDEMKAELADIKADLEALKENTNASMADVIELIDRAEAITETMNACANGVHEFGDYTSNGDATCEADGTKTAECVNGCGATDTIADEGSMLDHADEDGDKVCDDCEAEIIDTCPDCGRPVHEGEINEYICLLITIIRLIVSLAKTFGAIA